ALRRAVRERKGRAQLGGGERRRAAVARSVDRSTQVLDRRLDLDCPQLRGAQLEREVRLELLLRRLTNSAAKVGDRRVGSTAAAPGGTRTGPRSPGGWAGGGWRAIRSLVAPPAASLSGARAGPAARSPGLSSAFPLARTSGWMKPGGRCASSSPAETRSSAAALAALRSRPARSAASSSQAPPPPIATPRPSDRRPAGRRPHPPRPS